MRRDVRNPLARGFYTVPEAARLIGSASPQRIYGWLRGYPGRDIGPLLERDYQPIGDIEEISFLDLMEIRFVEHFRDHGVKMRSLRLAASALRKEFDTPHPFAHKSLLLVADKVDVLVREKLLDSAKEADDPRLRSLITRNYVMYEAIRQNLIRGVEFDAATNLAASWPPLPDEFPDIKVDPRVAYGHPALPNRVATATLYTAYKAANDNIDEVAYWFQQSAADVLKAIRFEESLDRAKMRQAA